MLKAKTLRAVLKEIYGVEDKYLVPISTNWFLPTTDPEDKVHTWIGYRILNKKPYVRAAQQGRDMTKPVKVSFRLTFVGPQAEEFADQTLLWEDRTDVIKAFEYWKEVGVISFKKGKRKLLESYPWSISTAPCRKGF